MSKSLNLTVTLLKRSGQETKLFVIITTLISALIFNFLNLMESDRFMVRESIAENLFEKGMIAYYLIIVLCVAFFVLLKANNYLIKVKGNEIGIEALSGISTFSLGFLLTVQTSILNFLGYLFGIILGVIISPIFNYIAFKEFIFQIDASSFLYMIAFLLLQSFTLGLINQGFGYRNEITTLLGINDKSQFVAEVYDKKLRFKNFLSIPIMLSMFGVIFIPYEFIKESVEIGIFLFYIPVLGCISFFTSFIPLYLDRMKERRFLNHKYNLIIISNLKTSIKKNQIIFPFLLGVGTAFPMFMILREYTSASMFFNALAFVLSIIFITFLMVFNGLSTSLDEIKALKQLRVLGYSKKEIMYILKTKINVFYFILVTIPLIFNITLMVYLIRNLNFSIGYGCLYIGMYVVVFFITTVITYIYSVKELEKNLL
ncbi:hypothetical protein [Cetobacterium sp.]|uniref:hypothetical protein n=1 Tax=Cetobacterium sp. TaxID=2071632 RepID=UPI003F2A4C67